MPAESRVIECSLGWQMWRLGPKPDLIALNSAISACATSGRWEEALQLGDDASSESLHLNLISYNSMVSALSVGQDFQHARELQVLEDMHQAQVTPDIITYNALLGACTRRADWQTAMAWLDELSDASLVPDVVTYGTTLAVFDQAEQWEMALQLFLELQRSTVQPPCTLFNSAMASCERASHWPNALAFFDQSGNQNDARGFNTAMRACGASRSVG
ncbi:Pentatricopeptide repeat-containing protein At5g02860 [Durusdinium trenchii]|uniref:Pentatricopeptide repeat-containing protein At5g02860 n=1 Tax=Durusdinium trenchii TaxID=1381693 RepID=A0ABP0HQV4_9DINO